ncbi:MAG: leucine-rich repeat domain-containing protein [Salinivirgaceae bacterium]|nr:leucine-rich repeat domain-containing protein [Salinivirgaceae bacterium]
MNQSRKIPKNEWTHVSWGDELEIGYRGNDYIGIQINLDNIAGTNIGNFHFRNIEIGMGDNTLYYANPSCYIGNVKYYLHSNNSVSVCGVTEGVADIIIPEKVTFENHEYQVVGITSGAFLGSGLTSIVIPNSVTKIGLGAFSDCSNLESVVIPNSVTSIGNEVFNGCISLTSITIPKSVTDIGEGAFLGSGLTSIVIPDSVTEIGSAAFSNCNNLESITFGSSVEKIGKCVFVGCNSLKNIVCKGMIPPKVDYELFNYVLLTDNIVSDAKLYMNATLTYPENTKLYKTQQPWNNFDVENGGNGVMDTVCVYDTVYQIVSNKDTVYFADNNEKHKVTATSANTKMGIAYGTGMFAKGAQTEIVAIEKYGYHFTKWSDGNTENPRFVNVTSDSTFTAQFEVNNYTVLAEANEKEMGKVEGAAEYAYLSRTQLKAVPNTGYKFAAWSDGETANPREILVYCDTTFTAVFEVAGTETVSAIGESAAQVNIYVADNTIVVENATDEIFVYNAMGALVCRDAIHRVHAEIIINNPGVYIVKTGNKTQKVVLP